MGHAMMKWTTLSLGFLLATTAAQAQTYPSKTITIVVTAAAPLVPDALIAQLKPGGKMVIPVGAPGETQELLLVTKGAAGDSSRKTILPVRFVPLLPGK